MAILLVAEFSFSFSFAGVTYVVLTRQESDGGTSLLLYADPPGIDLADIPPIMLLSDAAGDLLSARINRVSAGESHQLASKLLGELAGDLNDELPLERVTDLVQRLATWIEAVGCRSFHAVP